MVQRTEEVRVNFIDNTYSVITTVKHELFSSAGFFPIEGDRGGFSRLEKTDDGIYARNYLREGTWRSGSFSTVKNELKCVSDIKITHNEARARIKEIILHRRSMIY